MILVYNAGGGIYPGIVDFVHKELFPKSYPCNLCYQTFGTFTMKKEWKTFLNSIPLKKTEFTQRQLYRQYEPQNLPLPAILIGHGKDVRVLLSAEEINRYTSLDALKNAVKSKLGNCNTKHTLYRLIEILQVHLLVNRNKIRFNCSSG
jgi:hypothetical protein